MQECEQEEAIEEWKRLYGELLLISREQRDLPLQEEGAFLERHEDLARRWKAKQEQIAAAEACLKAAIGEERLKAIFTASILPTVREIQEAVRDAADRIGREMNRLGSSLRSFTERRQIRNAYAQQDYFPHEAMFFDEKK